MEFTIQHDCEDNCHLVACIHCLVRKVLVASIRWLVCESSGCPHLLLGCENFGCMDLSLGCVNSAHLSSVIWLWKFWLSVSVIWLWKFWLPTSIVWLWKIVWLCYSSFFLQIWAEILALRPADSGTAVVRIECMLRSCISTCGLDMLLLNI